MQTQSVQQAAAAIQKAHAVILLTGAGMGVDSGLPDFRGDEGFWKAYPPLKNLRISFHEMADPRWFHTNPALAWGFYGHRLKLYRETVPHEGHSILQRWIDYTGGKYFCITSNVDGQLAKAGFADTQIYEVHGSIHHLQCTQPCYPHIWSADDFRPHIDAEFHHRAEFPVCPRCGKLARPNVLMFSDFSWLESRTENQASNFTNWMKSVEKEPIVLIEIGAGKDVSTIRRLSESLARQPQCTLIRINPRDYEVPQGAIGIRAGGLDGLQQIDKLINW